MARQKRATSGHTKPAIESRFSQLRNPRVLRERPAPIHRRAARNCLESPLLRLPAELRERIWTFAFGNRTIHARRAVTNPKRKKVWCISFDSCNEPFTDNEVYAFNLDEASAMKDPRWREAITQARATHTKVGSHSNCTNLNNTFSLIVPTACKQLYYEAVPIAWKTSTFWLGDPSDFSSFMNAPVARIDLISQLSLRLFYTRTAWRDALNQNVTIDRLKALRGLNLVFCGSRPIHIGLQKLSIPINNDVREFRHIPLEENLTTVSIETKEWFHVPAGAKLKCADVVRDFLLKRSTPGREEILEM
jgi:hypothetical protein